MVTSLFIPGKEARNSLETLISTRVCCCAGDSPSSAITSANASAAILSRLSSAAKTAGSFWSGMFAERKSEETMARELIRT